jgi:hypothetical protein
MSSIIGLFCGTAFLRIFRFFKERYNHYEGLQTETRKLLSKKSLT